MPLDMQIGPSSTSKTPPAGMFARMEPVDGASRSRFDTPGSTRPLPPTTSRDGKKPGHTPPTGDTTDGSGVGGMGVGGTVGGTTGVGSIVLICAGMIMNCPTGPNDGWLPRAIAAGAAEPSRGTERTSL